MTVASNVTIPGASRLPAPDGQESWLLFDTCFGRCAVAWNENGITRTRLPAASDEATARSIAAGRRHVCGGELPHHAARAIVALQRYFAGRPLELDDIPVDLVTTSPFEHKVLTALRTVRRGTTTTYGALARLVGEPGAARAVGMAMARNPVPVIVPCHRVLASGNRKGGFSAPGGTATKERLLALEGVSLATPAPLLDMITETVSRARASD